MKRFTILSLVMAFTMIISACGAAAPSEPTVSPEQIQSTAVAAALTIVAETQAAIPTNTPVPPTDTPIPATNTPLPTDTPIALPTLDAPTLAPTTASNNNAGGDPCNAPLPGTIDGHPTKIRIRNMTKGTLVGSIYLNKTPFGECGYRGFNLGKNDALTYTDLVQGCYNVSVFVNGNEGKDSKAFGYGCINNPDLWSFDVYAEKVQFNGP